MGLPDQVSKSVPYPSDTMVKRKNRETTSHIALIPGQIFALMPVSGITSKSPKQLKFQWFTLRTLHTVLVLIGQFTMLILSIRWASHNPLTMPTVDSIIWFSSKFLLLAYFLWLAKQWPALMIEWERIEQTLPLYADQKRNFAFFNQIKLYTILITVVLLIEHTLCITCAVLRVYICTNSTSIENFFKQDWPQIYTNSNYENGVCGFFAEGLNYYCTFQWTYMDIFIISISICLSTRVNQLNAHLKQYKGMKMPKTFWIKQRQHFSSILRMIKIVDDKISTITAFSVLSNLYTILMLLLHSFQPQDTVTEAVYFWVTLSFVIMRTILVSLSAARIHDESRKPARVLRAIPNDGYDSEADRFLEHVVNTKVGITGLRFFYFTRPLILSVVGSIITYEFSI